MVKWGKKNFTVYFVVDGIKLLAYGMKGYSDVEVLARAKNEHPICYEVVCNDIEDKTKEALDNKF